MNEISPQALRAKIIECKTIGDPQVAEWAETFNISAKKLNDQLSVFLFGHFGCFYTLSTQAALNAESLRERVSQMQWGVLTTYQALFQGTFNIRSSLEEKGAYTTSLETERNRKTYSCLSSLPMSVQQARELQVRQRATTIQKAVVEDLQQGHNQMLPLVFQLLDDREPSVIDDLVGLERFFYSRAALSSKDPKTKDLCFTNWITLAKEWVALQDTIGLVPLRRSLRNARIGMVSSLAKLTEAEPLRQITPHEEIDAILKTPDLSFKSHFAWSAIREIGSNIGFEFRGPALQTLHDFFVANPEACLDLLYFTSIDPIDLSKLQVQEPSKKMLFVFKNFNFIKGWLPRGHGVNLQQLFFWLYHGTAALSGEHVPDYLLRNGSAAFTTTEAIAQRLRPPVEACLGIFAACLPFKESRPAVGALEAVKFLLEQRQMPLPGPAFWEETCRQLAPWDRVEEEAKLFAERMGEQVIADFSTMHDLLLLFLSGAVRAYEVGMESVVTAADLLKALDPPFVLIPYPLKPKHVEFCLEYLHACDRYNFTPLQKLRLFFNFLALQDKPNLVKDNYEQLCWIEKFSFCPLRGEHAFNWLIYHPKPDKVWELFERFERLKKECEQYLDKITVPESFQREFIECRENLATISSALEEFKDFDGFLYSINPIHMQIALLILPPTAQWWTDRFTDKIFEDALGDSHNPRTAHFTAAITPFGGSPKHTCCSWHWPPPPCSNVDDENPVFEIRIVNHDFSTRAVRAQLPFSEEEMRRQGFGEVVSRHAKYFGEENAGAEHMPPNVLGKLQSYFERLRKQCREAWKSPIPPSPFSSSAYGLDRDKLAAQGNVYPIERGISLIPPDLLLIKTHYERYTIRDECRDLIEQIGSLALTAEAKQLTLGPLDTKLLGLLTQLKATPHESANFKGLADAALMELETLQQVVTREGYISRYVPGKLKIYDRYFSELRLKLIPIGDNFQVGIPTQINEIIASVKEIIASVKEMHLCQLSVSYDPMPIQNEDVAALPFYLHEFTLRRGPYEQKHRYLQLVGSDNFYKWIGWHLLQLQARTLQ